MTAAPSASASAAASSSISFLTLIFLVWRKSVMLLSSSLDRAEKTSGAEVDESLSRIARSNVRAEGSAPPTLRTRMPRSISFESQGVRAGGEGRRARADAPSEDDGRDLGERDERRLLRDEQELLLEEVELALVGLEVALDGGVVVVPARGRASERGSEGGGGGRGGRQHAHEAMQEHVFVRETREEETHERKLPGVMTFFWVRTRNRSDTTSYAGSS